MIKIIYISIVLGLLSVSVKAQQISYSKTIGSKYIKAGVVVFPGSYGGLLHFEKKVGYLLDLGLGVEYYQGESAYTQFRSYTIDSKLYYELYNIKKGVYFRTGPSLNLGMENLESKSEEATINKFCIGIGLTAGMDIYFAKRACIFSEVSINQSIKSSIHHSFLKMNAGLKLLIL